MNYSTVGVLKVVDARLIFDLATWKGTFLDGKGVA